MLLQPGKTDAGALFTSGVSSAAMNPRGTASVLSKTYDCSGDDLHAFCIDVVIARFDWKCFGLQTQGEKNNSSGAANSNANTNTANSNSAANSNAVESNSNATANTEGNAKETESEDRSDAKTDTKDEKKSDAKDDSKADEKKLMTRLRTIKKTPTSRKKLKI